MILLLYFFVKRHLVILKKKIEIDNRQFLIDVNASQHSAFNNLLGFFFQLTGPSLMVGPVGPWPHHFFEGGKN